MLEVDIPDVLAELVATFEAYERALTGNDIETLNSLFWDSPSTVRYGTREAERQYGHEEIAAFRIQRGVVKSEQDFDKSTDRHIRTRLRDYKHGVSSGRLRPNRAAEPDLDSHRQRLEDRQCPRVIRTVRRCKVRSSSAEAGRPRAAPAA